ncbi:MAG TPA: hypothetical protein VJP85_03670 [Candidatus Baltobacteraceae bacterium]|nr:hypothetical protein [Candidatus Baltobacteraceae bacterium]
MRAEVDQQISFDTAVRSLFRHFDDADVLRRNPLTRRFFVTGGGDRLTRSREIAVVKEIRTLILRGAQYCYDGDVAAGLDERAYRQYAIVHGCYVEGKPIDAIANALGISIRQCYRERASICTRIAEFICSHDSSAASIGQSTSLWRLRMDRAASRAESGDYDRALSEYEELAKGCSESAEKIEALCKSAEVMLDLGKQSQSADALANAVRLLGANTDRFPPLAKSAARTHASYLHAKLAWDTGNFDQSDVLLERALAYADALLLSGGERIKQLYAMMLIEVTARAMTRGQFSVALDSVRRAGDLLRGLVAPSPLLLVDLMLFEAVLSYVSRRPTKERTSDPRLSLLEDALKVARSAGSFRRTIQVEAAFGPRHLATEGPAAALASAQRIMSMSRQLGNPRFLAATALDAADSVFTDERCWKAIPEFLRDAEGAFAEGSIEWAFLMHAKAKYYAKAGTPRESLGCEERVLSVAQRARSPRMVAAALRGLAWATFSLNRMAEAADYIVEAVAMAESHGSVLACGETFEIAANITGKTKYAEAAQRYRALAL